MNMQQSDNVVVRPWALGHNGDLEAAYGAWDLDVWPDGDEARWAVCDRGLDGGDGDEGKAPNLQAAMKAAEEAAGVPGGALGEHPKVVYWHRLDTSDDEPNIGAEWCDWSLNIWENSEWGPFHWIVEHSGHKPQEGAESTLEEAQAEAERAAGLPVGALGRLQIAPAFGELEHVLTDWRQWSQDRFPKQTLRSNLEHLKREIAELELLIESGDPKAIASEAADVLALAHNAAAMAVGDGLVFAMREKLKVNRGREWGEPDAQGVQEHVRGCEASPVERLTTMVDRYCKAEDARMAEVRAQRASGGPRGGGR